MKKMKLSIALTILAISTVLPIYSVSAAVDTGKIDVTNTIKTLFNERSIALKNKDTSKLKNHYNKTSHVLETELTRPQKYHEMIEQRLGQVIMNVQDDASIQNIDVVGDQANAVIYDWMSFDWKDESGSVNTSGIGTPHELSLVKQSGKWIIETDRYDEGPLTGIVSPDYAKKDQMIQKEMAQSLNTTATKSSTVVPLSGGGTTYNRDAAAAYADSWVYNPNNTANLRNESYYNLAYKNFTNPDGSGGDCANFVSQSMYAGSAYYVGTPGTSSQVTNNSYWWYNNKGTSSTTDDNTTNSWIGASNHRSFVKNGWGTSVASPINLYKGDVVYYDWEGNGSWDHVTVVVAYDGSGNGLVDSHNYDYKHIRAQYGGASCLYDMVHMNNLL